MKKALAVAVSLALSAPVYAGELAIESNGKTNEPLSSISAVPHDKIEGMSVYDSSGEKFGDVDRVVTNAGQRMVVIGIDGALGDGAKEVAVPFSSLSLTANHSRIVVDRPAAALRALPDVDPGDYARHDDETDSAQSLGMHWEQGPGNAKSHDLAGMDVVGSNGEQIGDIDRVVMNNGVETAIVGIDGFIGANAREVAIPLAKFTPAPEGDKLYVDYTQEQLKTMPDVDPGDFTAVGRGPLPTRALALDAERAGVRVAHTQHLEGKAVYSTSGKKVGDIDRVVMSNGEHTAIIGIDGIIGDGAKEVAVPLSRVTRSEDGDRVMVDYSESELKALPDVDPGDFFSLRM